MDRQDNVFYTDLVHVWKQTPAGVRSIAVRDVHTHELSLDAAGNLYGEHAWYTEATNWGYYIWCRRPDGKISKVIPDTKEFWKDYGFARDRQGTLYWMTDVGKQQQIRCKTAKGTVRTLATGQFGPAHWVTCSPNGTVYFLQGDLLYRLSPGGKPKRLSGHLCRQPIANHALMGLWTDAAGRVYVANARENIVQRITPDGTVRTVARSSATGRRPVASQRPTGIYGCSNSRRPTRCGCGASSAAPSPSSNPAPAGRPPR